MHAKSRKAIYSVNIFAFDPHFAFWNDLVTETKVVQLHTSQQLGK